MTGTAESRSILTINNFLGIELDGARNAETAAVISTEASRRHRSASSAPTKS